MLVVDSCWSTSGDLGLGECTTTAGGIVSVDPGVGEFTTEASSTISELGPGVFAKFRTTYGTNAHTSEACCSSDLKSGVLVYAPPFGGVKVTGLAVNPSISPSSWTLGSCAAVGRTWIA
jgi:hypothetical protein